MDARNTSCVTLVSNNNSNVSKYVSQHVKLTVYQVNYHVFVDNDVQNPISANDAYLFFAGLCCVCGCALPCPPDAHGRSPLLIVPSCLFRITSPLQRPVSKLQNLASYKVRFIPQTWKLRNATAYLNRSFEPLFQVVA